MKLLKEISLKRTRLIQAGLAGFLLGLVLAKVGISTNSSLVLASLFALAISLRVKFLVFITLSLLALNLGILRGQTVNNAYLEYEQLYDQKISIIGTIEDDPANSENYQTEFHINNLHLQQTGNHRQLAGRLKVKGFPEGTINRGDVVLVNGKLREALGNRQGQISYAEIETIGYKVSKLETLRKRFFAGVYTALPEPQASLGLGFLVGLRTLLPDGLLNELGRTGLTHIVAVSGYNLTILVRLTRRFFMRISKYTATAVSVALILGFIAATGLSPSIFRAAVVSGLSLAAWYYGRPIKAGIILLASAALTAGINPGYIWHDIGWYLSFLAFFGVLVVAPSITAKFFKDKQPGTLLQVLIETSSAQLMVWPVIAYIFGEMSLVALPANMLILPAIPFAMLLTFIAGAAGMFIPALVGWFAWPATVVLTAMTRVISKMSEISWAEIALELSVWQMIIIYLSIALVSLVLYLKSKDKLNKYRTVVD
ncbi:MAG: ComEC/Rec2 family competence protein [Candidatus Saccharimonadales bacterium]